MNIDGYGRLTFAKYSPKVSLMLVPVQTAFGNYLRQLRERNGLTVEQLAQKSGLARNRLSAIERGKINLNLGTLMILAMSLDTSLHDLLRDIAYRLAKPEPMKGRVIPFCNNRQSFQKARPGFSCAEIL